MTATMSCPPPADLRRTRKVSISSIRRQERQRQRRTSRSRSRSRSRSCSPCCSEGVICCDEGLICCDDAECAAGPLTSPIEVAESASSVASGSCSSATSAGHEASSNQQLSLVSALSEQGDPDCAECQAASDPCTADCFDGPVVAAEDCPECKASPTASNRSLPAINAADVLLDPLECTAVCDLIEWDDNAIDELVRPTVALLCHLLTSLYLSSAAAAGQASTSTYLRPLRAALFQKIARHYRLRRRLRQCAQQIMCTSTLIT